MAKYFTLKELTYSSVAKKKLINNSPANDAIVDNLEALMEQLDMIREKYGKPIYVNSGYRCPKLNKAVKGVGNSQHQLGCAADITTRSDSEDRKLYKLITEHFDFDQCIWETVNGGRWIHYSYVRPNRHQKFSIK